MTNAKNALNNVIGTMAIEGFELSDEDIVRCRSIIEGQEDVDNVVAELLDRHRALAKESNQKQDAG